MYLFRTFLITQFSLELRIVDHPCVTRRSYGMQGKRQQGPAKVAFMNPRWACQMDVNKTCVRRIIRLADWHEATSFISFYEHTRNGP
jgi:hypothetical protein